ncbi:MAG: type I methionyl aminopeptidase, partial [Spirochaetales bacterium]|nr:type I methionyl aminopeptidase [Spirochaetales bacterium]
VETILNDLSNYIIPGITTGKISEICEELMDANLAHPSAPGYMGYPEIICTSVNTVAVHGLPGSEILGNGDIITVDIILNIDGWHGDGACTYIAGEGDADTLRLYRAAQEATKAGIKASRAGGRIGDIGYAVFTTAARWGCSVIDELAGHGIGQAVHEDPVIMHKSESGVGLPIVPGMVFTVEPVLTLGSGKIKTLGDGWSVVSADGEKTAQFEHTVAIFSKSTEVLTRRELSFEFDPEF